MDLTKRILGGSSTSKWAEGSRTGQEAQRGAGNLLQKRGENPMRVMKVILPVLLVLAMASKAEATSSPVRRSRRTAPTSVLWGKRAEEAFSTTG